MTKSVRSSLAPGTALLSMAAGAAAAPEAANAPEDPGAKKPNIVFILADDLGYGDLGCFGQTKIKTPNLDRMAGEGVRFTQFYAGSPVCAPSRCVLMTGLHSGHAYIRDNRELKDVEGQTPLPAGTVTLPALLQKQGYTTGMFGKWGLGAADSTGAPDRAGWDYFYGYICQRQAHNYYPDHLWRNGEKVLLEGNDRGVTGRHYSHDLIVDEALDFVKKNKDKPFFLYLPFTIPHFGLQVPEDSFTQYRGKFPEEKPYAGTRSYVRQDHPRAAYAAMITRMDRDIGRLLTLLQESGLDDDTLVIFTSDNGPAGNADVAFFNSAGPLRAGKGTVYEGGIRVPMVARWPGRIAPGGVREHAAAFYDVLPTFLEAAGAPPAAGGDGLSFLPALLGQDGQPAHPHLYWEFNSGGGQQAVRIGNFKGVRRDIRAGNRGIELYDLAGDIGETTDIAGKHPEVVARIRRVLEEDRTPSAVFPLVGIDAPVPEAVSGPAAPR